MKPLNGEILMYYNRNCTLMNSEFCESTHQGKSTNNWYLTNIEINYHRILNFFFYKCEIRYKFKKFKRNIR